VAGEQDGEALVANLLVRHLRGGSLRTPFFILCGKEHAEQVAMVPWIGAALGDHAEDQFVEVFAAAPNATHQGQRQPLNEHGERKEGEREKSHEGIDGGRDFVDFAFDIGIEEGFADDAKGEEEHVRADINERAVLPGGCGFESVEGDELGIRTDALAMEGGLCEAALAHVQRLFTGQQTVTEDHSGALHDQVAMVMRCIPDEHFVDQVGVIELEGLDAQGFEVNEVAELIQVGFEEIRTILTEGAPAK